MLAIGPPPTRWGGLVRAHGVPDHPTVLAEGSARRRTKIRRAPDGAVLFVPGRTLRAPDPQRRLPAGRADRRDRHSGRLGRASARSRRRGVHRPPGRFGCGASGDPVSYTHLTLPTI